MAIDPVCGMEVEEKDAKFMVHLSHQTYYFCSQKCKDSFEDEMSLVEHPKQKGIWNRFLSWLAGGAEKEFSGKPPKCH